MRFLSVALIGVLAAGGTAGIAGCSSAKHHTPPPTLTAVHAGATSAPATDTVTTSSASSTAAGALTGSWSGSYSGAFTGTFTLTWTQDASRLSGTINLSTAGTVPLTGTVSGSHIQFGTVGSTAITYSGSVSGDSMSGSYQVAGAQTGSWSAHRS